VQNLNDLILVKKW